VRVRATDAARSLSGYSNTASATTAAEYSSYCESWHAMAGVRDKWNEEQFHHDIEFAVRAQLEVPGKTPAISSAGTTSRTGMVWAGNHTTAGNGSRGTDRQCSLLTMRALQARYFREVTQPLAAPTGRVRGQVLGADCGKREGARRDSDGNHCIWIAALEILRCSSLLRGAAHDSETILAISPADSHMPS
jgi:hypothetical protein